MFNKCNKLKEIKGIDKLNTNKVTNMYGMFQSCYALKYLDLSNFDTSNVLNMEYIFRDCKKLKEIKGTNSWKLNKITNMHAMCQLCLEV